jgi:hypothetical protein
MVKESGFPGEGSRGRISLEIVKELGFPEDLGEVPLEIVKNRDVLELRGSFPLDMVKEPGFPGGSTDLFLEIRQGI